MRTTIRLRSPIIAISKHAKQHIFNVDLVQSRVGDCAAHRALHYTHPAVTFIIIARTVYMSLSSSIDFRLFQSTLFLQVNWTITISSVDVDPSNHSLHAWRSHTLVELEPKNDSKTARETHSSPGWMAVASREWRFHKYPLSMINLSYLHVNKCKCTQR